jgi:hypothetical protein
MTSRHEASAATAGIPSALSCVVVHAHTTRLRVPLVVVRAQPRVPSWRRGRPRTRRPRPRARLTHAPARRAGPRRRCTGPDAPPSRSPRAPDESLAPPDGFGPRGNRVTALAPSIHTRGTSILTRGGWHCYPGKAAPLLRHSGPAAQRIDSSEHRRDPHPRLIDPSSGMDPSAQAAHSLPTGGTPVRTTGTSIPTAVTSVLTSGHPSSQSRRSALYPALYPALHPKPRERPSLCAGRGL